MVVPPAVPPRPAPQAPSPRPAGPVRRLPVPVTQPPYDDELDRAGGDAFTQGALALAFVLPGGAPAVPEPPAQLRLVDPSVARAAQREAEAREIAEFSARRPTPSAEPPAPRRWPAQLAQAVAEALAGHRPVQQLLRWTNDEVYAALLGRAAGSPGRGGPVTRGRVSGPRPVVRALRLSRPRDGVVEASAVVQTGARCRALALRLEGLDGRWRATALDVV